MHEPRSRWSDLRQLPRRAFLQVGYSGCWGWAAGLAGGREAGGAGSRPRRARSVIVILLSGGLGQHDSFDMKPEAPGGDPRRVQADRDGGARHPDVRALARPGGAGRTSWRSSARWPIPRGTTCWRSTAC